MKTLMRYLIYTVASLMTTLPATAATCMTGNRPITTTTTTTMTIVSPLDTALQVITQPPPPIKPGEDCDQCNHCIRTWDECNTKCYQNDQQCDYSLSPVDCRNAYFACGLKCGDCSNACSNCSDPNPYP